MRPPFRFVIVACCLLAALAAVWLLIGALGGPAPDPVPEPPPERTPRDEIRESMWEEERLTPVRDTGGMLPETAFFRANRSLPLAVGNGDFARKLLEPALDGVVLDAREPEERAIGSFPGSVHVRFGDLREGAWRSLPRDKVVYVVCYSGVRGELVAQFLRERGIVARYWEEGASQWVADGGQWDGEIDFYGFYDDQRFRSLLPAEALCRRDAVLVDTRPAYKFQKHRLPGARNVLIQYATTPETQRSLAEIPAGKPVILVCDDYSNCFDATIAALRLQKLGHAFIGLYQDLGETPACLRS